ncbi:MAG: outer membrane beta-barrel protein [Acidobacteria bacterium]|jgi:opacity protein-like surface antigen|nr:outer membrane beta-barrel protein [Acidobacteriota bacterium]
MKRKTPIFACLILALALALPAAGSSKKTPAAKKKVSPAAARAKQQKAKPVKFFVRAGYAMGLTETSKDQSWSEPYYAENTEYSLTSRMGKSTNIDLGAGYNLNRSLSVGLGAIILANDLAANLSASVPHPYVFNAPRTATGAYASDLKATIIYLNFIYKVSVSKFTVDLFAGPAYFNASADILSAVAIQDAFPNAAVIMSLVTENVKKSSFGFTAGAGVSYFFARNLGIFVEARYLSGNTAFASSAGVVPAITLPVGGLSAGGGLLFRF